jgi:hypothetical protein
MSTTTVYGSRKFDVLAWNGDTANGGMFDASSTGKVVAGIWKLVQRFLITFLHEPGSMKYSYWGYDNDVGTSFIQQLRSGAIRTDAGVYSMFALAETEARHQLLAEETDDDPDDERYKKAELKRVVISNDTIDLTVQITSLESTVTVVVPIPSVP